MLRTRDARIGLFCTLCIALLAGCPGDDDPTSDTDDGVSGSGGGSGTGGSSGSGSSAGQSEIEWVRIDGGSYMMGSEDDGTLHEVAVPTFWMARTEVTVSQFDACVAGGGCEVPEWGSALGPECNLNLVGREQHPMNCLNWFEAVDFCAWAGGRLPTESEWEYAARSGGQDISLPWGDEPASCAFAHIGGDETGPGCGTSTTAPVCSMPAGNSSQGLCDLIGNADEWVRDCWESDYEQAPTDGSAYECSEATSAYRVTRGGSYEAYPVWVSSTQRSSYSAGGSSMGLLLIGFRCAK